MNLLGLLMSGSSNAPFLLSVTNLSEVGVVDATMAIPLPADVRAGDVLVVLLYTDENALQSWDNSTAGAWVGSSVNMSSGSSVLGYYSKVCDGSEAGLTLAIGFTANSLNKFARLIHIRAASAVTASLGSYDPATTAPDPPGVSYGTVDATLVMAAYFAKTGSNADPMTPPAGYGDASAWGSTNNVVAIGLAFKTLVGSAENPGAFTLTTPRDVRALVMAFR